MLNRKSFPRMYKV